MDVQFFKWMCEQADVPLIATDDQLNIRFWNTAAARLFGQPVEVMIGQPVLSIVPPQRQALVQRLLERALRKGESREFEYEHKDLDGRAVFLAVTVSPIQDEQGQPLGVSIGAQDITRSIGVLRQFAEAQRMSALGMMAGAVAHHFNNLLGGVVTTLDFARSSSDPRVLHRYLRAASSALARATALTRNLLFFAEGEHDDSPQADISETVRGFIAEHEPQWAEHGVSVETDLQPTGAQVPVDRVVHIIDILATNACEAMPGGGRLRFEVSRSGNGTVLLKVSDTGVGIPPEQIRQVFEPFFTTKRVLDASRPGHVGLGLAVVHGIVRDLGGTVCLESNSPEGTSCVVRLPADPGAG
jgi:PAS domain S-box-containing protein